MLSKPESGWTDFQLPGSEKYGLSFYSAMIPTDWLGILNVSINLLRNEIFLLLVR